jgi:hypothetical protein
MFNFKCQQFTKDSYCMRSTFAGQHIISGAVFNEKYLYQMLDGNISDCLFSGKFELSAEFLENCDYIIITELNDLICWPYIYKRFNLGNKVKFITTEPILQIGKIYLIDFYNALSKLIIDNEWENVFISDLDINDFIENSCIKLNYNQKHFIQDHLKLSLSASGYSLGSSNIIFEYYNKRIAVICNSSVYEFRYPKTIDTLALKSSDIVITQPDIINTSDDYVTSMNRLVDTTYSVTSKFDITSSHYSSLFIPCEPLFILDFVDYMRYKISKENRHVFIGKSIKGIIEYSNISHGYINQTIHNKIYEFMLPFGFDELFKNSKDIYYFRFLGYLRIV